MVRLELGLVGISHVLEFRPSATTSPSSDETAAYMNPPILYDCVTAMRLASGGCVGVNWIGTSYRSNGGALQPAVGSWSPYRAFGTEPYTLTEEMIPVIQSLAGGVSKLDDPTIRRALGRFGLTYEYRNPADKLVDSWIALESIFLPDEPLELKYKAAMRIARFIGRSSQERLDTFLFVQKSYKRRSQIVHGEPIAADMNEVMIESQSVLRRALSRLILELPGAKLKKLARDLDNEAASGIGEPR